MSKEINNEIQYQLALERIYYLMNQPHEEGTEAFGDLNMLLTLVEAYEEIHYPMPIMEPIELIKQKMHEKGLKQADLIPFVGNKSQVSRILNKKRELTLSMIRKLSKGLNIPVNKLVGV